MSGQDAWTLISDSRLCFCVASVAFHDLVASDYLCFPDLFRVAWIDLRIPAI